MGQRGVADAEAPAGIERVADLYAAAAGRFMMVADQRALDLLVKQASARPEIAYVGVESVDERCSPTPIPRASAASGTSR